MSGISLYTSNRIEKLVEPFIEVIFGPGRSLFQNEIVVVQNKGMQQWLSLQIAENTGICSFCSFPFPNAFVKSFFNQTFSEKELQLSFDSEINLWRIYCLLPSFIEKHKFDHLKAYLANQSSTHLYNFAKKIADIFDQYTIYRDTLIKSWEAGDSEDWQAVLWRELKKDTVHAHRVDMIHILQERMENQDYDFSKHPPRVSLFGISSLPPFYLSFINAISKYVDIHYFVLSPTIEYWDDIVSQKEAQKLIRSYNKYGKNMEKEIPLHIDEGNSLLSAFGSYGRDFIARMHDFDIEEYAIPAIIEPHSILEHIQSDIFHLKNPDNNNPRSIDIKDTSIQIHACHSQQREIEILYNFLLHLFNTEKSIIQSDIVVMAPDIEAYAPHIKAVFGTPEISNCRIDYSISDYSLLSSHGPIAAFCQILDFVESRFPVTGLLSILETPEIHTKFNMGQSDIGHIKTLLRKVAVNWGIDGTFKSDFDVPATSENTWYSGLEQLFLGFALPSHSTELYKSIFGCNAIEGFDALLLGNFAEFFTTLKTFRDDCRQSYSIEQWPELFVTYINKLFTITNENKSDIEQLFNTLHDIQKISSKIETFNDPIPYSVIKQHVVETLSSQKSVNGFMLGNVTFCSILPMRSIPFKVICLIGMNDSTFPRKSNYVSWNEITVSPKKGDRSLEQEDRYVFLETLLSCRSILYISYVGFDLQNSTEYKPSTCVTELLSYVNNYFTMNSGNFTDYTSVKDFVVTKHYLHSFNRNYFVSHSKYFSYSADNFAAAATHCDILKKPVIFFDNPLKDPGSDFKHVQIQELTAFYKKPSKYLLRKRLQISFDSYDDSLNPEEPFTLDNKNSYTIADSLIKKSLSHDVDIKNCYDYLKASNQLPHGSTGLTYFNDISVRLSGFIDQIKQYANGNQFENHYESLNIGEYVLSGVLSNTWPEYQILFRYARIKPFDYISAWIQHLFISCCKKTNLPKQTILLTKDIEVRFQPVQEPEIALQELLDIFYEGLMQPIPFFSNVSWIYAKSVLVDKISHEKAIDKVLKTWYSDERFTFYDEKSDPYVKLCFTPSDIFGDQFISKAVSVFKPIFQNVFPDTQD
jgi:exodeoxyribonuclease V gamma subunit